MPVGEVFIEDEDSVVVNEVGNNVQREELVELPQDRVIPVDPEVLGIMQIIGGEMYVKNAPSPENMEQNQVMVDSMWETISKETAEARGISVDSLNYFIENLSISFPEDMVKHNLADEVLTVHPRSHCGRGCCRRLL